MYKSANIFILCLSLFLFSFTDGRKKMNDLEINGIKGKVKTIWSSDYYYLDSVLMAKDTVRINIAISNYMLKTKYNEQGNILSCEQADGKVTLLNVYDKSGNKVTCTKFDSEGKLKYSGFNKYDAHANNIIESRGYSLYDDTLNISIVKYKYDAKGNIIEADDYNEENKLDNYWKCIYDSKGNKTDEIQYDSKGKFIQKRSYLYNDKKNITKMVIDNLKKEDGQDMTITSVYNDNNEEIKRTDFFDMIQVTRTVSYKREYDKNGNWIKMVGEDDAHEIHVFYRVIEYY